MRKRLFLLCCALSLLLVAKSPTCSSLRDVQRPDYQLGERRIKVERVKHACAYFAWGMLPEPRVAVAQMVVLQIEVISMSISIGTSQGLSRGFIFPRYCRRTGVPVAPTSGTQGGPGMSLLLFAPSLLFCPNKNTPNPFGDMLRKTTIDYFPPLSPSLHLGLQAECVSRSPFLSCIITRARACAFLM